MSANSNNNNANNNASPSVTIGTHNGTFHCDEVTACYLLKQLPKYREASVRRTRDPSLLEACDIVVDVGGVYDPALNRFDHHQREFKETFNSVKPDKPWDIKLSSAGLVYCHFGRQVLVELTGLTADHPFIDKAYDFMYEKFILEIDAIDNGIEPCANPKYKINSGLSSRVSHLNASWNEKSSSEEEDARFARAVALVGTEFSDRLSYYQHCWWPARGAVEAAFNKRRQYDAAGRLLVLSDVPGGLPWKSHLMELEREAGCAGCVLYALYSDANGAWRVQAVPVDEESQFENRRPLPAQWRGLREEQLSGECGVEGCVFVHSSGFIGGNRSFDGAMQMAVKAMLIE